MSNDILTIEENKGNRVESKEKFENNQLNEKGNEENSNFALEKEITSRLMNTKIVRIRPGTICACNKGFKKLIFNINTISSLSQDKNDNTKSGYIITENGEIDCKSDPGNLLFDLNNNLLVPDYLPLWHLLLQFQID